MDKLFERNFRFHVKWCIMGKVHYLVCINFSLVLTKLSSWEEEWALSYNSLKFWDLPKILSCLTIPEATHSYNFHS